MGQINLNGADLRICDGAGNCVIFTNIVPPKMPRTRRQQDKHLARLKRVGGRRRTARSKKKYRTAEKRACVLAHPYEGVLSWTESTEPPTANMIIPTDSIEMEIELVYNSESDVDMDQPSGPGPDHGASGEVRPDLLQE